jgi:hypothetical protein
MGKELTEGDIHVLDKTSEFTGSVEGTVSNIDLIKLEFKG